MKKITSYFSLLLMMLFISLSAKAQDSVITVDEDNPFELTADMFSSPFTEPSEGSIEALVDGNAGTFWHSVWSRGDQPNGVHYFQVDCPDLEGVDMIGVGLTRRNTDNDHFTQISIYGAPSDEASKEECTLLCTWDTPVASHNETVISPVIETQGFTKIRIYEEHTTHDRGYFHVAEFMMYYVSEADANDVAREELGKTILSVTEAIENMEAGTKPAQYDEALLDALLTALDAANIIDEPEGEDLTVEQINELNDNLKKAYDAAVASRVPYVQNVKPGYYFIRNGLGFFSETSTEATEDPETGEEIPGESTRTYHIKGMYANGDVNSWGDLDRENARYLWKIEAVADTTYCYTMTNMAKNYQPISIEKLGAEGTKAVSFDWAGEAESDEFSEEPVLYYNIRLTTAKERNGAIYLHANNHGGGAGKGSNIVGWYNTFEDEMAHASEWVLEPVGEEAAKAILAGPATKIAEMLDNAAEIAAAVPAQMTVAKDIHVALNMEEGLITDASQFSSPYSQNDLGGADGQSLDSGCLIDNNPDTYWHSYWGGGDVANGTHYLQISDIDTNIDAVAFKMVRRKTQSDHVTKMTVYGFDEDNSELTKEDGELLATLNFPNPVSGATITSDDVFLTKGHSVLRIYAEETSTKAGNGAQGRGYWHAAEVQLYPATVGQYWKEGTSQYDANKALAEALEKAVEKWNAGAYSAENVSDPAEANFAADYKALVDAYNAWQAVYVNPEALRNAVAAADGLVKGIVIGNNPGQWKDANTAANLTSAQEKANAYDKTGKYNPKSSEELIAALSAEKLFATANPIQTGKWYNIRFGTEEEFDEAGWNKDPVKEVFNENINADESHALYGKVIAVAKHDNVQETYTDADGNERTATIYNVVPLDKAEDATMNAGVAFIDKSELANPDDALWQFIAIGDTAYVLQNKATGLYLRANGTMGATRMSVHPTTYKTSAIGFGKSLIKAYAITGEDNTYLHAERATNNLVTWNAYSVDSNSALYLEEKGDVSEAPSNEYTMNVWPGQIQTLCYPTAVTAKNGKLYAATLKDNTVTLNPMPNNMAEAGQPVVYIADGTYEPLQNDKEAEGYNGDQYVKATFVHGTEFVAETKVNGSLTGVFNNTSITKGNVWAANNAAETTGFIVTKAAGTVGANTAYIATELDAETVIELVISDKEATGIEKAIENVSKAGNIYTIDGKFVGKGNLNSLNGMNKGIYIVNGVKVIKK